jgi:hypothetical protein
VFAHSEKHGETLVGNNVSATMFPSLPRALGIVILYISSFCSAIECDGRLSCLWKLLGDACSLVFKIHESKVRFVHKYNSTKNLV